MLFSGISAIAIVLCFSLWRANQTTQWFLHHHNEVIKNHYVIMENQSKIEAHLAKQDEDMKRIMERMK